VFLHKKVLGNNVNGLRLGLGVGSGLLPSYYSVITIKYMVCTQGTGLKNKVLPENHYMLERMDERMNWG